MVLYPKRRNGEEVEVHGRDDNACQLRSSTLSWIPGEQIFFVSDQIRIGKRDAVFAMVGIGIREEDELTFRFLDELTHGIWLPIPALWKRFSLYCPDEPVLLCIAVDDIPGLIGRVIVY